MNGFSVKVSAHWTFWCYDKDGSLKWKDEIDNLVVTEGRNALLDNTFNAAAGSVDWYVGLVTGPGSGAQFVAADTLASHGGWLENTTYSGNRKAWTKNGAAAAGAMSNSSSKAVFTMTGTTVIGGGFLGSAETGTTGTLYGGGTLSSGDRSVVDTDILNVQVDLSITSS